MVSPRQQLSTLLSIVILCGAAAAQTAASSAQASADAQSAEAHASDAPAVTASASESGARFASPGEVLQMRLQIYAAAGELVFDSGARAGSVIDWKIADVPQGLADGAYLCVVTVKDLHNRATQKLSAMSVAAGRVSLAVAREDELTAAQSKALASARQALKVNPSEVAGAQTVMREGKERAVTVTSHDGQVGAVTSTTGALTFRTGDFFAGTETEQMRVTAGGRVGIGTTDPQATLDVAGTIRARGGIVFDDGTVLKSAQGNGGVLAASVVGGTVVPAATGAGTANQLAKWADNAGTLGNSNVTESNGNIGIGIANPTQRLHVVTSSSGSNPLSSDRVAGFVNDGDPANHAILAVIAGSNGVAGIDLGDTQNQNQSYIRYNNGTLGEKLRLGVNNTDMLTIQSGGNVGIGTINPAQRLEVMGNLKLSGAGNALIFPDGTSMTTAAAGGGQMSGTSIISAINDAATAGAISDKRLSANVARLNGA
ncbi:MAG: trimeric autotransporter adhesin, partial [Acidobacteriota bacterium]|nr:trimeric autotransporter adhesin [Acidobacteriota bacterium]